MNERLQKIADDLGTNVYKDALHGQIAKENFIYGVKQAELESEAFYTAEMLRKEKEEADHLREVKQMVVDKACKWVDDNVGTLTAIAFRKAMEGEK